MEHVRLKDVCTLINGRAYKQEELLSNGKYPVLRVGNFFSDKDFYYSDLELDEDKYCDNGDLLFAWSASFGPKIWTGEKVIYHYHIWKMVLSDRVDKEYLYYYLIYLSERIKAEGHGGIMIHTTKAEMEEREILLPSLEQQKEFVCILNRMQTIIQNRKLEVQKLDDLIKARFVELFGDPMVNPNGYETRPYGTLFELNAGGTPSKTKPEYWENGTISWIGSNLCQNEILYENDGKYISQDGYDHSSARLFPIDTVLIALVGATIGKTALLKFETSTNQNVLGVRHISESGYNPMFVYYYTQFLYQKFMNIGDGGFNMASKGFVSELPMYDIGLSAQNEFAAFAEQVDKSKSVVQESLDETQLLFDSLMQKYFG